MSDVDDEEESNLLHLLRPPLVEEPVAPCCSVRSHLGAILRRASVLLVRAAFVAVVVVKASKG